VTPDLVDRAAELRRDGFGAEAIAERLGVSLRSTFRALALARDGLPQLPATEPLPLAEALRVGSIERAGQGDWRAAAWLLERRWPERWDRTYRSPRRRRAPRSPRSTSWPGDDATVEMADP
jgi:hypothetical protein